MSHFGGHEEEVRDEEHDEVCELVRMKGKCSGESLSVWDVTPSTPAAFKRMDIEYIKTRAGNSTSVLEPRSVGRVAS